MRCSAADLPCTHLLPLLRPQIQRDVERARRQACGGGESTASVEALALALSNMGYDYVRVRRATGGGAGASCLRNLRHSFLLVAAPGAPRMEVAGIPI